MVGKDIRSIRQLARESGTSIRSAIISFGQYGTSYCKVIWFKDFKPFNGEGLCIFNNQYNNSMFRFSTIISAPEFDKYREELSVYYSKVVCVDKNNYKASDLAFTINSIRLLPESFEDDYYKFFNENQKVITPLIHRYGFSPNDAVIKRIFASTGDSKNFFTWAINAYYRCGTTLNAIKRILWWNENYKQLVKKLSKGTITAYTSRRAIFGLFDEMNALRREKRINDVINMFNTAQKKILRSMNITDDDKKVFSSFYRLSENKKINFVKKMSTITDHAEIMRQMRHVTSTHFNWSKESFMDYVENVEGINYEKIFENDDTVLVKVNDFETVKQFAKTTNWCISKNKSYWNNYVGHIKGAEQYVLFDFSQKEDALTSIVGFTCKYNKGITNAHDFTNNSMMGNGGVSTNSLINSYISHLKNSNDIYLLLEQHGININLIAKYDKPSYNWDRDSMYKYLYECVEKSNVCILTDNGEQVAISVKDSDIKYFLGDSYIDNVTEELYSMQHIIFMDFAMNQHDPNRIMFAIVHNEYESNEDYVIMFKNEHYIDANVTFEAKLSQFGLPYDTIRRIDNKFVKLRDAIRAYDTQEVMNGIKNKELFTDVLYDYIGEDSMEEFIKGSIVNYVSFDYLDIFYNNKYKLSDFLSYGRVENLVHDLLHIFIIQYDNSICHLPTQKEIDAFFNRKTTNIHEARTIGLFLALDKILASELVNVDVNEKLYNKLVNLIITTGAKGDAIDHFVEGMLDNFDITKNSTCLNFIFSYTMDKGGDKLKGKIESLKDKSKVISRRFEEIEKFKTHDAKTSFIMDSDVLRHEDVVVGDTIEIERDEAFQDIEEAVAAALGI